MSRYVVLVVISFWSIFSFVQKAEAAHTYSWLIGSWIDGANNTFTRSVVCKRNGGVTVKDAFCPQPKPESFKSYSWVTGDWGSCSATACGTSGTQVRSVSCIKNTGIPATDPSVACADTVKPIESQSCSKPACFAITASPDVSDITESTATFRWTTSEPSQGQVSVGTSPGVYTIFSQFESSFKFSSHIQTVKGLTSGKTYYFKVVSTNMTGSSVQSPEKSFTTTTSTSPDPVDPTDPTEPPPPSPLAPIEILIEPVFKTAGIIIKLPPETTSAVSARIFYKRSIDASYQEGHKFTKYDLNNMATSLFNLTPKTSYDVRIDYFDGSVTTTKFSKFETKADRGVALPVALRTLNVSNLSALQSAINNAIPGDHIVVAPGTYLGSVVISNKIGTAENPIVIRGASYFDPKNAGTTARATFDGNNSGKTFSFVGSAFWILDNVEVKNAYPSIIANYTGSGIQLYSSSNITIQRSYIHDNGFYNINIGKSDTNTAAFGGPLNTGHHLIQENFITDTSDRSVCEGTQYPYNGCTDITYEGIYIGKSSGGVNIIRGNKITNMIDGITIPGDGAFARQLSESVPHVLKLTNTTGLYMNHDNEAYGNEIFDNFDDDIECDGIGVNIRIYDNILGGLKPAHHALTAAPFMPGPLFIVRNIVKNYKNSALKMNTGGEQTIPSRNIYLYHNTFVKLDSSRSLLNLWYGGEGSAGFKNGQFINNIFYAPNGGRCTSINTSNYGGPPGTTLDSNLWYTPTTSSSLFQWYNGSTISNASSLSGFKINSGQEFNGLFIQPGINSNYVPMTGSPAIDKAVRIPGINNRFNGIAPDIGATEY